MLGKEKLIRFLFNVQFEVNIRELILRLVPYYKFDAMGMDYF